MYIGDTFDEDEGPIYEPEPGEDAEDEESDEADQ